MLLYSADILVLMEKSTNPSSLVSPRNSMEVPPSNVKRTEFAELSEYPDNLSSLRFPFLSAATTGFFSSTLKERPLKDTEKRFFSIASLFSVCVWETE